MAAPSLNPYRRLWEFLARLVALVLIGTSVYLAGASLPDQLNPEMYICTHAPCQYETVTPAELAPLARFGLSPQLYVLYRFGTEIPVLLAFLAVSLLIVWRRSDVRASLGSA